MCGRREKYMQSKNLSTPAIKYNLLEYYFKYILQNREIHGKCVCVSTALKLAMKIKEMDFCRQGRVTTETCVKAVMVGQGRL